MAEAQVFQEFVENWPTSREGTPINLQDIQRVPISMFVSHFDTVCEPARAEFAAEDLDDLVKRYHVYYETDADHLLFTRTSQYYDLMREYIDIGVGEAKEMKLSADDFIRRTGGYINPASPEFNEEDSAAYIKSLLAVAVAMFLLI